jgi:HEAT repeat protein
VKKAALTLKQLLDAEDEAVRLGAAKAILDGAMKLVEVADLQRRVETLESLLSEKTP